MAKGPKQLSNPFSTGGGGSHFENQVQSAFVVLMLTGGVAPCLPPWPIIELKLQGRYAGYETDDMVATVEEKPGGRAAKLLVQIKHALSISAKDAVFSDVMRAAWGDFNSPKVFNPSTDFIGLVTGPLSAHDAVNTRTILDWARKSASASEFLFKVERAKFSSGAKREKLAAFRTHLKAANGGTDVEDEKLFGFLRRFHLLGYDLDIASGVTHSLLNSHIGQFSVDDIDGLWAKVAQTVSEFNQAGGTIVRSNLPGHLVDVFKEKAPRKTQPDYRAIGMQAGPPPAPISPDQAEAVAIASLIGSWNDSSATDLKTLGDFF